MDTLSIDKHFEEIHPSQSQHWGIVPVEEMPVEDVPVEDEPVEDEGVEDFAQHNNEPPAQDTFRHAL